MYRKFYNTAWFTVQRRRATLVIHSVFLFYKGTAIQYVSWTLIQITYRVSIAAQWNDKQAVHCLGHITPKPPWVFPEARKDRSDQSDPSSQQWSLQRDRGGGGGWLNTLSNISTCPCCVSGGGGECNEREIERGVLLFSENRGQPMNNSTWQPTTVSPQIQACLRLSLTL